VTAARLLRPTLAELWTFLAVALPVLGALLAPMAAVDLAYQLRAGAQILDTRAIPSVDAWTFTIAGTPWTDQQWGAQVLLGLVYRAAGWSGLMILRAGLVALAFGLLLLVVRRRSPGLAARWQALLVLGAFLVASPALALRPQLFAIVLFAATLFLLADRRAHPRRLWLIPILALAWANLHGSFPLVLLLLGLAVFADVLDRGEWRISLTITVVSALATLVNPFGLDVWGYVVRLATNPTIGSRVSEWRPPGLTDVPGLLFWGSVVLVIVALGWRARRRLACGMKPLPGWPALLTLLAFAALGAVTGRGLAWWPLAAVFVWAGLLRDAPTGSSNATASPSPSPAPSAADAPTGITNSNEFSRGVRGSPLNALVAGLLMVAGVALLPFWRPVGAFFVPLGVLTYAPLGIAGYVGDVTVRLASPGLRVWAPQHWGSWLELASPSDAVAVDSRIELYPASVWADYDTVESGSADWQSTLDRDSVTFVITEVGSDGKLEAALTASGTWGRVYTDADGSIWGRLGR